MKNSEKLTTLSTQDTGPRKTKQKTQHKKLKRREAIHSDCIFPYQD